MRRVESACVRCSRFVDRGTPQHVRCSGIYASTVEATQDDSNVELIHIAVTISSINASGEWIAATQDQSSLESTEFFRSVLQIPTKSMSSTTAAQDEFKNQFSIPEFKSFVDRYGWPKSDDTGYQIAEQLCGTERALRDHPQSPQASTDILQDPFVSSWSVVVSLVSTSPKSSRKSSIMFP